MIVRYGQAYDRLDHPDRAAQVLKCKRKGTLPIDRRSTLDGLRNIEYRIQTVLRDSARAGSRDSGKKVGEAIMERLVNTRPGA